VNISNFLGDISMRKVLLLVCLVMLFNTSAQADINVPPGFVVDTLLDQIDGQTPRLEAIRNPDYGFGVVAASVDERILKVLRISQSSVMQLAIVPNMLPIAAAKHIRFDTTGLFANKLYVSVHGGETQPDQGVHTDIFEITPMGNAYLRLSKGSASDALSFIFDFTSGEAGYIPGMYLEDGHSRQGSDLYHMDPNFNVQLLGDDVEPNNRTDLDVRGMQFDTTGLYGYRLTMADSDDDDKMSVIYQLLSNHTSWRVVSGPNDLSERFYLDMCFSNGGVFGKTLYVTDRVSESVITVDPNGQQQIFASGFTNIESVTVSEDGNDMFVSDSNGVYRIRAGEAQPGPQIIMREPLVENDDVHTGKSGVDSVRILWNEKVLFNNNDVNISDEDGNDITLSVSGSNSQFMIIAFSETLLNDRYTITIHDTVISAITGAAIDGDNDGLEGGDAVLIMEHRYRHDSDNDNDIDFYDFSRLAEKWLWKE
jgi:hypothetical protein